MISMQLVGESSSSDELLPKTTPSECIELNLLLLGQKGVGKTTLVDTFRSHPRAREVDLVNGVQVFVHDILEGGGNRLIRVKIWDPENYSCAERMIPEKLRSMHAAILVYDGKNMSTFKNFEAWYYPIRGLLDRRALFFVIGTKYDRKKYVNDVGICFEEVQEFAEFIGAPVFLTSALVRYGVDEAFTAIIDAVKTLDPTFICAPVEETRKADEKVSPSRNSYKWLNWAANLIRNINLNVLKSSPKK